MAARYAPVAFDEINAAFSDDDVPELPAPVSCVALLARQLGASDQQAVMAAGLAGGIGLCGSACGALGAAIWIMSMRLQETESVKNLWNDPTFTTEFDALVDRFLQSTDYEFVCADIVGRKFEDVSDHAAFVSEGGCANIISALAAP